MTKTKIFILYTGGTIGMAPSNPEKADSPLVPQSWEQLQQFMPAIQENGYYTAVRNIEFSYYSFPEVMDSSQLTVDHWVEMANIIYNNYASYDGFIIIHGTDTMAFTASGLSFMLANLSKPVVLTGSQLPISHSRTDAISNFSNSIHLAGAKAFNLTPVNEVTICFNDRLYRGNRCTKASTRDLEGFLSPNYPALAELEETIKINKSELLSPTGDSLELLTDFDTNVVVLTLFPGFQVELLKKLIEDRDIDGLLIKTYGSGNAPCTPEFLSTLKRAKENGTTIMFISQCLEGGVHLGKYAASDYFTPIGVVSGGDMTSEAALAKMMWVLGQTKDQTEREKLLHENLRGERS